MIAPHRIFLFFTASLCLARIDPEWNLGTVVDSSLLRPSSTLETPVYAPSGLPVADVPGVQLMAIQSSQFAIIGEKTAYIVDKPGERPRTSRRGLSERVHLSSPGDCLLTPRREVLYYHEQHVLHVLDDNGQICKLPIVGQEALHPEK